MESLPSHQTNADLYIYEQMPYYILNFKFCRNFLWGSDLAHNSTAVRSEELQGQKYGKKNGNMKEKSRRSLSYLGELLLKNIIATGRHINSIRSLEVVV